MARPTFFLHVNVLSLRRPVTIAVPDSAGATARVTDAASTDSERIDYSRLRQDLSRAVARICPRWLCDERDDLVQSAVMRVMQVVSRRSAADEGNSPLPPSYLYRVAHSALVDEIRRVRRRRETGLEDEAIDPASEATDPEQAAGSRQIGRAIQDCLMRLTRDRRLAVMLHLQGHSVPSAAEVLDWPTKRTENLVYRGLANLRACLRAKGMRP